jgi:dihydrofolate reductase
MRKLILSLAISPDGFCGHDAYVPGDDWSDFMARMLIGIQTIILGRKTYQLFEAFWPAVARSREGSPALLRLADELDRAEKVVISKTLTDTNWRNVRIESDLDAVARLKAVPGKDIIVFGGASLISSLIDSDLVDEYHFAVVPVLAGSGPRLSDKVKTSLRFLDAVEMSPGVVLLRYGRSIQYPGG